MQLLLKRLRIYFYILIMLHKPHPRKELLEYQAKQLIEILEQDGLEPEKAYKGSFNVRISPELHKQAVVYAVSNQISLNRVMEEALSNYVVSKKADV